MASTRNRVFWRSCALWCTAIVLLASTAYASVPSDPRELETFLDSFINAKMQELHIPGAVVAIVQDGGLYFTKGYGFADLENQKPVIPEETLFRVASVSKLFTATAVMQMEERGSLEITDDVNKHLTLFKIEETFPQPVTIANLLTHTAGFDDRIIGIETREESKHAPLGTYLADNMPPRFAPPWDQYCYSNHGMALAGYLVEAVSGIPFAQYVDRNILQPLGMERSSFVRLPALAEDIAIGYRFEDGAYRRVPFQYLNDGPAGALNTTVTDIARFMIAHLQRGRYGEARILAEETADEMHRRQFGHHSRLPGACYGFFEILENNQRLIGHIGEIEGFGSLMVLLPEHNLGIFLAYNSSSSYGTPDLRPEFGSLFLDHYFPVDGELSAPRPPIDFSDRAQRFVGSYLANRYSRSTMDKVTAFFAQFEVEDAGDGTLTIHYPLNFKEPSKWVEVEPLVFQRIDGDGYAVFREDEDGRITHLFVDAIPIQYSTRLSWYQSNSFHLAVVGTSAFVFLSGCIVWPLGFVVRRIRNQTGSASSGARRARWLAGSACLLNLVFLVGFVRILPVAMGELYYGVPPLLVGLLCVPLLAVVPAIGSVASAALAWKNGYWSLFARMHYTLVSITCVVFVVFLNHWNLLGFKF